MSKLILTTLLILFFSSGYSQSGDSFWKKYVESDRLKLDLISFDSINYKKAFRIWNQYQVVELIQLDDSTFHGQLVNFVTKRNRNKEKNKTIKQTLKIPDYTVSKLIETLSREDIANLKDSKDIEGYVTGFDGTTYIFEINAEQDSRIYSYWEPENDHYQNPDIKEVKSVRNILKAIKTEIDLWSLFSNFTNNLKPGTYNYGMIIMQKI